MKSYLKINLLGTLLFIIFSLSVHAQNLYELSGKITYDNQELSGATISIKGTTTNTNTGSDGSFLFQLKEGNYRLVISAENKTKEIEVNLTKNVYLNIDMADAYTNLEEVLVSAVRVKHDAPVTHSNVTKKELQKRNLGQDIPILINYLPSVVTTSDAGAGVGYTGIRVRGSDATRVNVTINGIPYNDPESQATYWVDLPDFASSVESLQLQRGVGTSTNGSGAFGASINLLTDAVSEDAFGEINTSFGSYNTAKLSAKFSTGLISDHIEFAGRFSKIKSDGYIDRAWSDLNSFFFQGSYVDDNTLIKLLTFGGHEKTYQAWYGVTKEEIELYGRTYNPYTYENEIDNYRQNHYQLLWNEKFSELWSMNIGLNYTKGKGYYEQYKDEQNFSDYDFDPIQIGGETIDQTDLIRRRWLDNDYYVLNANTTYQKDNMELIFGGSTSMYSGDHYGEIIWAEYASNSEIRDRYYESQTDKYDSNIFAKLSYKLTDSWSIFADIQSRFISFNIAGLTSERIPIEVDENYAFFNPKLGITHQINIENSLYASFAKAQREPNRQDFEHGISNPEILNDFELGWRINTGPLKLNTNLYYMLYKDQLVLSGAIDDTGAPIRTTSGKSYRLGIELDAFIKLSEKFVWQPNIALSSNKNIDFVAQIDGGLVELGTTNISYSPNVIAGSSFEYQPLENIQLTLLSKFVGRQYMGNIDAENSILDSYFVNDFNAIYTITPNKLASSISLTLLINNIFNTFYISNGYYYTYDDTWSVPGEITTLDGAGYYPQATRNFLVGATIKF